VSASWVVVPVEPTDEMEHAADLALDRFTLEWQAAIDARPTGPEVPTMIDPQELAELKRDPARVSPCIWECSSDPDVSFWNTSCGEAWTFITDGPKENGMKFCPYCGGTLRITITEGGK
jgi:hypothetical protein